MYFIGKNYSSQHRIPRGDFLDSEFCHLLNICSNSEYSNFQGVDLTKESLPGGQFDKGILFWGLIAWGQFSKGPICL